MPRLIEEKNPYTLQFSFIPPLYIERRNDTSEIISNFVREVPTYRGMFITGVRGSGKTVLLADIRKRIDDMECWIAVDINPETELVHSLVGKLYRINKLKKFFVDAKLDFSIAGLGVKIENAHTVAYNDDDVLEIMLSELKKRGIKLLVTIDEITYSQDVAKFSHALSSYAGEGYDIYLLMTGLKENIDKIKNQPSLTFLYRAKLNEIGNLNITAISAEYQKTLQISQADADRLAFESRGYSLAFQIIGHVYWKALSRNDSIDDININEVENEIDSLLAELAYDKIFEEFSKRDIEVLRALTILTKDKEEQSIKVEKVRDKAKMSSETFATYRKRLVDSGVIDGKQYGYLRFKLPRFGQYIGLRK